MVVAGAAFVALGLFALVTGVGRRRTATNPAMVADLVVEEPEQPGLFSRLAAPLLHAGARIIAAVSPTGRIELTRRRIVYAGLEGRRTAEQVLSQRAVYAFVAGLFGFIAHPSQAPAPLAALAVAVLASFIPDVRLDAKARQRQRQIAQELPDALDLLSITVEAGLGLEQAISIVADRLQGPLGDELRRLLREVELGVGRRNALALLRQRTDVRELSSFVVALLQADALGMAVAEVLRSQAHQVRVARRQRAREAASKTPVKILFPMIVGIFPSLFIVTIGPGVITVIRTMFRA